MVGMLTLPKRTTGFPATSLSFGLLVFVSTPMPPFSPGAPLGQSAIGSDALAVKTERKTTSKNAEVRIFQST